MYLLNYFKQLVKAVVVRFPKRIAAAFRYVGEFQKFKRLSDGRFSVAVADLYPCLNDRVQFTPFDQHYLYHPAWAIRKVVSYTPPYHVDVSSKLYFGTMLSAVVPVRFYDYRPAKINLSNYTAAFADLNALPFESNTVPSLSCMHTIEHIGLGRYGDQLDAKGDLAAIAELKRVLMPGGSVLFVTPVGRPRIEFNAHRVYSFEQIVEYFSPLQLVEFSMVPDEGGFNENADPSMVASQRYACGCFWFKKL